MLPFMAMKGSAQPLALPVVCCRGLMPIAAGIYPGLRLLGFVKASVPGFAAKWRLLPATPLDWAAKLK